jgi:hypothetical protein
VPRSNNDGVVVFRHKQFLFNNSFLSLICRAKVLPQFVKVG